MKTKTRLQKIRIFNIQVLRTLVHLTRKKITWRFGEAHRTKAQALKNAKKGVGIKNSKHIYSLGVDIWITNRGWDIVWDANDPRYKVMGEYAEKVGLRWGSRWKRKDPYHLEYKGRV